MSAVLGDGASSHSTDLIDNIERVLRKGNAKLFDVDLFAVTVGPGTFTGLRIGLATVKAFAVCVQKPCAAVSTLAAIAHAAGTSETTVSILPAGRGEVYAQAFSVRGQIVKAFVVLGKDRVPSEELKRELQDHCKRVTAPYKYPREIEFLTEFPKTISGKIRRVELRQRA